MNEGKHLRLSIPSTSAANLLTRYIAQRYYLAALSNPRILHDPARSFIPQTSEAILNEVKSPRLSRIRAPQHNTR